MFLEGIRKKAGRFLLRRKLRKLKRKKQFVNLAEARTVGILFQPAVNDSFEPVNEFVARLRAEGKEVFVIGYVDDEKVPDFLLLRKGYQFFCRNDLNWYLLPEPEFVNDFIKKDIDLLVNLSFDDLLPLDYINSLSRARFKSGRFIKDNETTDFSIDVRDKRDIKYLIEQISHYLQVINRK